MGKTVKLVKKALKSPLLFSEAELSFFRLWLQKKKEQKKAQKKQKGQQSQ
jgi:hypothetical protein